MALRLLPTVFCPEIFCSENIQKNDNSIKNLKFTAPICLISLILVFSAIFAYGQQQKRIAIVNTEDDGEPPLKNSELTHITDRLREIATKILPQKSYAVMTQQSIVAFLDSQENMVKECRAAEGCLAKLGRKINADYIGQARIGRYGEDLTIKVELYESGSGNLVNSFTEISKDIYGLLSVLDKKAPDLFTKLPGVSSGSKASPIIPGGIRGLEKAVDYEFDGEKRYLVNLSTEPPSAALSFDGVPSCPKTPCKVELREGSVRIIAALEQYETADTAVSVFQNNQNIAITLKPNFGILEIKPAYSDGIGGYRQWNLSINDTSYFLGEVRLSPNEYSVKLSHKCYEDISFEVGINKGKREVFNMASHITPKKGGLTLSAERDGEPVSEFVFVNGRYAGETPFSETVPICAKVEIGSSKEVVDVNLKYKKQVEHIHRFYEPVRKSVYVKDIAQKSSSSYTIHSMLNFDSVPFMGAYYQRIWDMHHVGLNIAWLYLTLGTKTDEIMETDETEFIIGLIHRWIMIPDDFKMSFGLFGGIGGRGISYNEESYTNWRHELGVELLLGYLSLYISERNFQRIGVGIGLISWYDKKMGR